MSELERFTPQDQDLLIGLFYRVGVWISHIDDTDEGTASEEKEHAKLLNVLQVVAKSDAAGCLVNDLAAEAVRQNTSWARWAKMTDNILSDVAKARATIKAHATPQEYVSFGKAVMMIGTSVARAFREESDMEEKGTGYLSWLTEKAGNLTQALTDREAHKDMNISPAEDTALNDLLDALRG